MSRFWIVVCCLACVSCNKTPSPPTVPAPSGSETINGSERIGWDQSAADSVELATFGYAIYIDGARSELGGVSCTTTAIAATFSCTARLPAMTAGSHTLQLASFAIDTRLESARSAALPVVLAAQTSSRETTPALRDGFALRATIIADGLESPTDVGFAPDGRIFVAERSGRIRVVRDGRLVGEPAISLADMTANGELLAIALSPEFERTHQLFAIYTAPDRSGAMAFTLARCRESGDTLGDCAVLLDAVPPASPEPAAALRFGADGKLYAAFDDGGDLRRRRDAASLAGKVIRLNADGTTPADARASTPVLADGYQAPVTLDWDPMTSTLWVADRGAGGMPFAFYRGSLFPQLVGRMVTADTVFKEGASSAVNLIAIGPDGAIYYGTARAIGRLLPDGAP